MKKITTNKGYSAFTIVEVMVAMVVLAIGLLGMAGMTIMVIKGGTDASRMTYATNLASDKMESLKDVAWANLGSAADSNSYTVTSISGCGPAYATALTQGCLDGYIMAEPGLNQQGLTTGTGPFPFTRRWVICQSGQTIAANINTSGTPPDDNCTVCTTCAMGSDKRPDLLSCDSANISASEKRVRILVTWRDKSGKCHSVHMQSVLANLGS